MACSNKARLELPESDPAQQAADLEDSTEIIRWYQHFIDVKLVRAVGGCLEEDSLDLGKDPKDSDGSAKVALTAIDRSIVAWGLMHEHFQQRADETLDILVHLGRLRKRTEETFPNARTFVRPGFDW